MIKEHFKNIGKKIIQCPSCQQRLRVPIKPGKTLQIICGKCQSHFHITFQSPLFDALKRHQGQSFWMYIKSIHGQLPEKFKWILYFAISFLAWWALSTGYVMLTKEKQQPVEWESTAVNI